jgi:hypothetical protein
LINSIGISIHFQNWPLPQFFKSLIHEFFEWADFSISWRFNSFIMVLFVIVTVFLISVITIILILTFLNKNQKHIYRFITKIAVVSADLLAFVFVYPMTNVFLGVLMCYTSDSPYEYGKSNIKYESVFIGLLIVGLLAFVFHFILALVIRFFIFDMNCKSRGLFPAQNGIFEGVQCILITGVIIISIVFRMNPLLIGIIGSVVFLALAIYPLYFQPYFNPKGNAITACIFTITFVFHIFGIISIVIDINRVWPAIVFWIAFVLALIFLPIIAGYFTYRYSKSRWAMYPNEMVPVNYKRKSDLDESVTNVSGIFIDSSGKKIYQQSSILSEKGYYDNQVCERKHEVVFIILKRNYHNKNKVYINNLFFIFF